MRTRFRGVQEDLGCVLYSPGRQGKLRWVTEDKECRDGSPSRAQPGGAQQARGPLHTWAVQRTQLEAGQELGLRGRRGKDRERPCVRDRDFILRAMGATEGFWAGEETWSDPQCRTGVSNLRPRWHVALTPSNAASQDCRLLTLSCDFLTSIFYNLIAWCLSADYVDKTPCRGTLPPVPATVSTFVNNYFQGRSTWGVKLDKTKKIFDEHLENSGKTVTNYIQPVQHISFTKTRSNIQLVLCCPLFIVKLS